MTKNGEPPSAVPAYGSDKLPRLTYSIAPQFGNRGTSRSDVKTRNRAGVQIRGRETSHEDACAIGSLTLKLIEAYDNVTTPTEQICHSSTLAINVQLCHH